MSAVCSALEYPHYDRTEWSSGSQSPATANGWYMTGEINIQTRFEGNPPDLQVITRIRRDTAQPRWLDYGFYQSYVQFEQSDLTYYDNQPEAANADQQQYHNYVCSVRYTESSEAQMSSSDLYQSNSCGPNLLSEIDNLKYDRVTDSRDCNSPWSPVIE